MAIQEVLVSKIFNYTSEPTKKVEGQFWFNPSTNVLSRYNGTAWKPITVSSDDVAVLSDGNKISLTNYLNTQIAALAEGIDTKQDKLKFYSEVSGSTPSATISVANIKLSGKVAEGSGTTASGIYSHAEGNNTKASGYVSHAEGFLTTASGNYSHAEGIGTTASGDYSHAEGFHTTASRSYQHVQGIGNIEDSNNKYADIIGNGSYYGGDEITRSNAATVSWDGISWSQTDVRAGGTDQDNATYSLIALAEGIDTKQDKLKFYSEVDKSDDTSSTAEASKLTLKTSASQYGGSEINLIASNGEYNPGNINLKAKSWNTSNGGNITLESEGGSASGGNITLHSKVNTGGSAEPGGKISLIADGNSNAGEKSNISLQANSIQLNGNDGVLSSINISNGTLALSADNTIVFNGDLAGSGIDKNFDVSTSTYLESKLPTTKFVHDLVDYQVANLATGVYAALEQKQNKLTTYTENSVSDSSGVIGSTVSINGIAISLTSDTAHNGAIILDGNITGPAISTTIPASNTVDTKIPSEKAVRTELDKKQDKLKFYSELGSDEDSSGEVSIHAHNTNINSAHVNISGTETGITLTASGNADIKLNGPVSGTAISTYIKGTTPDNEPGGIIVVDTKVPSEKAVYNALETKQKKLYTYSETIPTDKSYPEEVVITAKGQDFLAAHGAGTITLLATDSTDSGDDFAPGTINLNATKVQKKGKDIATTDDLANKQNKLRTYSESSPSDGLPSAAITAEVGLSLDSKQIKIGGGIFNSETIIDGWSKGYAGTSKIKVNGSSISLQTTSSDYEGSLIELTQNTLAINSDNGITGNILEKTISSSSVDTKIPTAKAVYTAVNAKANKSTTLSGYGITNAYTKTEVNTELGKKQDALNCYRETASGEAIISNATSFSVNNTSDGLIVENSNGGITIRNNSFKAGQAAISFQNNYWHDGSAILFDYDGQGVSVSDALLIPEIKDKQNSSDSDLTTNNKTIVGAINELNTQINTGIPEPITSVYTISSTALSSIISNTTYTGVSGQILISADVENTGPILIGEGITDKANAFPIYPDQIFPIPFSDINNFKVTGNIGNKFNYIISFRSLNNTSPAVNGGITILNENGYYKLTPEGDGDAATLTITKLK